MNAAFFFIALIANGHAQAIQGTDTELIMQVGGTMLTLRSTGLLTLCEGGSCASGGETIATLSDVQNATAMMADIFQTQAVQVHFYFKQYFTSMLTCYLYKELSFSIDTPTICMY